MNAESLRLQEARARNVPWKKSGNAWECFSHDQAHSRAYD
jgi:hypothetical protein